MKTNNVIPPEMKDERTADKRKSWWSIETSLDETSL